VHAAAAGDWSRAGRAWLLAGEQAGFRFAFADAEALLTNALDAADRAGEREVAARAYLARGRVRDALTAYPAALADLESAADLARATGDRRLEMVALRELAGDVPVSLGVPVTEGAAHLHDGLRIAEMLGDRAIESDMLGRLAIIASNRLHFTEALGYGNRAVRAARASGDECALASALDGLKTPYAYLGEIEQLVPILTELEPLLRRQGDLWRLQWTVYEGAFPALAAGRFDEALVRIADSLDINRRSGYAAYEGWFVGHLGRVHRLRGDLDQARAYGYRAVDLTRDSTHAWWRSTACTQLAGTLQALGETTPPIELLEEGRAHASREGAEAYLLNCLGPLADVTGDRSMLDAADALLQSIEAPEGCASFLGAEA
jgi:tetratricopeptide (TPR) repeat protein